MDPGIVIKCVIAIWLSRNFPTVSGDNGVVHGPISVLFTKLHAVPSTVVVVVVSAVVA